MEQSEARPVRSLPRDAYFAYSTAFSLDPKDARVKAAFDRIGRPSTQSKQGCIHLV